ncbi:hypothetical protein [Saccharicrinis fermentans]|uniref:hypothetical protein n=1 Tax=Saccharicrinis fermentans TaxID=982 RepID=UPI0004B1EE9F|nr:hypothetical protein [Saccharicrinis fermentans]
MMKLFSLIFIFVTLACEPDGYDVPEIDLVPVYSLSETANEEFSTVRIYQQKNLLTVSNKDGGIVAYQTKDYADSSDDLNFNVSVVALDSKMLSDGEGNNENEVQITYTYVLSAPVETGECVLTITSYDENSLVTGVQTIQGVLTDDEIYN